MKLAVLALALLATGCTSREIVLDKKYAPLAKVQEISDSLMPEHVVTTIYGTSYVPDLKTFEKDFPEGSIERHALLLHERVHSIRELGNPLWFLRYGADASFRWDEEKHGYKEEIQTLRANGHYVDVQWYANGLSGPIYTVLGVPMTSYSEAAAWVGSLVR